MIPRIKEIKALADFVLYVVFDDGHEVYYDVKEDIEQIPSFRSLSEEQGLFAQFTVDASRTCVTWSEDIDLPSDSIYEYGRAA